MDEGKPARTAPLSLEEKTLVEDLQLLTTKPKIIVMNVDEDKVGLPAEALAKEGEYQDTKDTIYISAAIEAEISTMDANDSKEYMEQYGLKESGLEKLIKKGYEILGLMSFLTTGEKESRAWTIPVGTKAVEAAGVIHTDFMQKFIKAEVVSYNQFVELGGWKQAKEVGKARMEGRDYIMQDGDVVEFMIGR